MAGKMIIGGEIVVPMLNIEYGLLERFLDYIIAGTYATLPNDLAETGTTLDSIIGGINV